MTKEIKKDNSNGLAQATVQLLAWTALFCMFLVDKVLHLVVPPLPEYWYGIAFGVAITGKIMDIFRSNRDKP